MTAVAEALVEAVRTTNEDSTRLARRLVPLAGGQAALIDPEDYELLAPWRIIWHLRRTKSGKFYAIANVASAPGGKVHMHRLINGTPDGFHTDHVNGDGLDNRRINLRTATPSQNHANIGKYKQSTEPTSAFKGVSWAADRGKWFASIYVNGRQKNLGRFADEAAAARAYDAAAVAAWGEFARLNFPEGATA